MIMNEQPSLTKGIFVHKAKGRSSPKKKRPDDVNQRKLMQFRYVWRNMEKIIMNVSAAIHEEATSFVLNFVRNCFSSDQRNPAADLGAIPTIALIMGVNIPDHSSLFGLLSKLLWHEGAIVTTLQSKDCYNLPALMQKLVQSLVQQEDDDVNVKRSECTFETLASWYEKKIHQKGSSPHKKRKISSQPLVILFEDVEGFPPHVLQHFILICNHYLDRVPLVLVLGVATAMVTVHSLLPLKVTSCLAIKVYTSPLAMQFLNEILDQVLIRSDLPFRLGPKVYKFLTDIIIYHDFSVSNLSHMLKFCVFEHYFSNSASALTYETVESQMKMIVNNLPSLQNREAGENSPEFENTQNLHKKVQDLLKGIESYNHQLGLKLDCLHAITHDLPGSPLGKQKKELYLLFLQQQVADTEGYKNALKLLRFLNVEDLQSKLRKILNILMCSEVSSTAQDLSTVERVQDVIKQLHIHLQGPEEEKEARVEVKKDVRQNWHLEGKPTRQAVQEQLLKLAKERPKSKLEIWKDQVLADLNTFFSCLVPLGAVPLHEAVYFDDVTTVKQHLNVSPRMAIHTALVDPHRYLQCKCCSLKYEDDIPSSLPPTCLAYKLMLEGGKLINIHDWLQSYMSIKDRQKSHSSKRKSKNNHHDEDKVLQAEFFQALSELQMLGIVKPSKRKTDHVARLTWVSC